MSWLKKGEEINKPEFFDTGVRRNTREFWLKPGKENARDIIFLDDPDVAFHQHSLKIGEDYERITCLEEACPACARSYYKTAAFPFTILDTTPFKDKEGKERKYSKKIFLIRGKAMKEVIDSRREANGGTLAGLKIRVMRTDDKAPNSGDDIQVLGRVNLEKLPVEKEDDRKPFEYEEMYKPLSPSQMESKLKIASPPQSRKKKAATAARTDLGGFGDEAMNPPPFGDEQEIPF